jgi:hypothetical protein
VDLGSSMLGQDFLEGGDEVLYLFSRWNLEMFNEGPRQGLKALRHSTLLCKGGPSDLPRFNRRPVLSVPFHT